MKNLIIKRRFVVLFTFLILVHANFSHAHGEVNIRKNCGILQNKYKSKARVHKSLVVANHIVNVTTCSPCYPVNLGGEAHASLDKCAFQKARYCNGAIMSGETYKWYCSRGFATDLVERIIDYQMVDSDEAAFERSKVTTGEVIYTASAVKIPAINGEFVTFGQGMETYFEIKVWIENTAINDTVYNDSNTIVSGRVGIFYGKLLATGAFAGNSFSMTQDANGNILRLDNFEASLTIPHQYRYLLDAPEDSSLGLVITIITHGGFSGAKALVDIENNYASTPSARAIDFIVGYDAEANTIAVEYTPVSAEKATVNLYEADGRLIGTLYTGLDTGNVRIKKTFSLDRYSLQSGMYFITFEDGANLLLKKIIR